MSTCPSTIIKAGAGGAIMQRLSTMDLVDHLAEARHVTEDARRRAIETLNKANLEAAALQERVRIDAEQLRSQAQQSGWEEGRAAGFLAGQELGRSTAHAEAVEQFAMQQRSLVDALHSAVDQIVRIRADMRSLADQSLWDFVFALVRKLTYEIGLRSNETVVENLKRAVRLVSDRSQLVVRVHPQDESAARSIAAELLPGLESKEIKIITDDSFRPGGCRVEALDNCVDATLETQIDSLALAILGEAR